MENQETPKHTDFSAAEIVQKPKHYLEPGTPSEIPQQAQDELWRLYDLHQDHKKNKRSSFSEEHTHLLLKYASFLLDGGIYVPKDLPRGAQIKTYGQWMREGYVFQMGLPLLGFPLHKYSKISQF